MTFTQLQWLMDRPSYRGSVKNISHYSSLKSETKSNKIAGKMLHGPIEPCPIEERKFYNSPC